MGWTIFQKQVPTIYYTVTLTNIVRPSKWSHVVFEALIWLKKNDYPSEKILSQKILSQKLPPNHFLPKKSYPKTPIAD